MKSFDTWFNQTTRDLADKVEVKKEEQKINSNGAPFTAEDFLNNQNLTFDFGIEGIIWDLP